MSVSKRAAHWARLANQGTGYLSPGDIQGVLEEGMRMALGHTLEPLRACIGQADFDKIVDRAIEALCVEDDRTFKP